MKAELFQKVFKSCDWPFNILKLSKSKSDAQRMRTTWQRPDDTVKSVQCLRYIQQQEKTQEDKSTSTGLVRRSKPSSGKGEHTRSTQLQDYIQTYQVRQSQSAVLGAVSSAVADTKMTYWKEEDTMYVPM
ncbi:LOW QUALITY PROTEIN: plasma membrane antiporter [Aspergillus luchuensis]|uniref:Plasma membrane antiporter n=1 Tax=Aspergillus kawachii TaxID=1069201 RepID=A0A146FKF4_ASPKA|nr:LOW QUALITY PROTEIN: plasma membrane antiporter [Aspergillus luchuensis]